MLRRLAAILVLITSATWASSPASWAEALPAFRLLDPIGRTFTDAQLAERGAIVVVTAPTHSQGDAQQAWSDALHTLPADEKGPALVMLEDMSQSWFRPIVMARMKDSYRASSRLWLLLDEGGVTRKALGVGEAATVAFAFGPGGRLVAVEQGSASAERAKKLLEAVRGAR